MTTSLKEMSGPVEALFSDLDGTLTTDGRVVAQTYVALEKLGNLGIPVILVTGRPAGWAQALATLVPFLAVVAENGGVTFYKENGILRKIYGVPPATIPEWRRRMQQAAVEVMNAIDGMRLSSDSKYREVDLALDWNEEARVDRDDAERAVEMLHERGLAAVRSSVHVNFGPSSFDKLSACKTVVSKIMKKDENDLSRYVYVGDALNDAPMFAGFAKSVGVANVRKWWDELSHKPSFITAQEEGEGLREVTDHVAWLVTNQK